MTNRKSYPPDDGRLPKTWGKNRKYVRCPDCGGKVQMPCFLCASRARAENESLQAELDRRRKAVQKADRLNLAEAGYLDGGVASDSAFVCGWSSACDYIEQLTDQPESEKE